MKKILLPIIVLLSALAAAVPVSAGETSAANASHEGMKMPGEKGLTRELIDGDELVKKHCTICHTEARVMTSLQSMHSQQADN